MINTDVAMPTNLYLSHTKALLRTILHVIARIALGKGLKSVLGFMHCLLVFIMNSNFALLNCLENEIPSIISASRVL